MSLLVANYFPKIFEFKREVTSDNYPKYTLFKNKSPLIFIGF